MKVLMEFDLNVEADVAKLDAFEMSEKIIEYVKTWEMILETNAKNNKEPITWRDVSEMYWAVKDEELLDQ